MKKTMLLAMVLLGCILLSLCVGRYYIAPKNIINIFLGKLESTMDANIFLNIRLPRTILVVFSGGALALSGFVYQSLFRNPLVSPDVMGVSSGASVGAIFAILFFKGNPSAVQISAFLGGIIVVLLSLLLSKAMGGNRLYTMILSGIIMGSFANSIIMTLKYTSDPNRHLAAIEYWLMGSFNTASWRDVKTVLPICLVFASALFLMKNQLRALSLGDDEAQSLGVNIKVISMVSIVCATLLVSTVVSISGVISWIGLIVPHITRIFAGESYLDNFNQSFFLGGILLVLADTAARSLLTSEIPISILTSLMGGIFLLIFLYLKNRR